MEVLTRLGELGADPTALSEGPSVWKRRARNGYQGGGSPGGNVVALPVSAEWEAELAPRIARLRRQYFTHRPSVCVERALAYTEVFKETEGEPTVIRRAKGLKRTCETKTILIQDDELIIGNAGRKPRTGILGPEMSNYWFDKEIDTLSTRPQDPYIVDEEQKALFREKIHPYWKGKTVIEHWLRRVPADTRAFGYETGVIDVEIKTESGPGEIAPGYGEILLPKGWSGIRRWAEERLAALDPADPASEEKGYFLQAVVVTTEAMGILARRHAEAARELAKTSAPERAAELERVAEVCDWIATEPPRTFHEALQLIWFAQFSLMMELNAPSYSPNRMDQYLLPYYEADLAAGDLTLELPRYRCHLRFDRCKSVSVLCEHPLVLSWRTVAKCRVPTERVVEALDVAEDREARVVAPLEAFALHELGLEGSHEALGGGALVGVSR